MSDSVPEPMPVSRNDRISDPFDDAFDDAFDTRQYKVPPSQVSQPLTAQQLSELDEMTEMTAVDYLATSAIGDRNYQDTERHKSRPVPEPPRYRQRPHSPTHHQQPAADRDYRKSGVPAPGNRMTGDSPRSRISAALPLPAPPSKTGKHAAPANRMSEAAIPERMTLAGTSRTRLPNYRPFIPRNEPAATVPTPSPLPAPPKVPAPAPAAPLPDHRKFGQSTAINRDPLAPLNKPLVGGKYHLVERIGAGGMGKVFKVTHSQLGKTFALKIISDNLAQDSKVRDLFYREARMASSLSHPNIASVVDFGEDNNLGAFMVMELLTGAPLHRVLHKEKRLGIRRASDIVRQLAQALGYIHSKGIVHCDIKTENILLCEQPGDGPRKREQVKLLDFGLAKNITGGRNTSSLSGTPHYVAPERIRGAQPSPSNDIYGVGILYYELLTGRVPWDGNVDHILNGHLNMKPVPPSRLIEGGLDPAVEKLVLRALAKTPGERHKNMDAFLYELKTVMDMLGYGRSGRRKRGGVKKISRTNQRDEMARSLFDASRVPMALIQRGGSIVIANKAFAQFIMGVSVDVEGMNVTTTPLINAWTTFDADLERARGGTSMRRVIELEIEPGRMRRLLMWLDPGLNGDQAIFGVHPLDH